MNSRKRKGIMDRFFERAAKAAAELQPVLPPPSPPMTHEEIMKCIFVADKLHTKCVMFVADESGEYDKPGPQVVPLVFIDPKFHRLILAIPTMYKQLSVLRDNMRRLEEYAHETANPFVEDYAAKQAEGANAAMMVATLGIEATGKILQHAQDSNEL